MDEMNAGLGKKNGADWRVVATTRRFFVVMNSFVLIVVKLRSIQQGCKSRQHENDSMCYREGLFRQAVGLPITLVVLMAPGLSRALKSQRT